MSKTVKTVTETVAPVVTVAPKSGNTVNPNSIRQLVCTALLAGTPTAEIAALVQARHPDSAAALKSTKHIAWYRADLRKRGLLPKVGATAAE